MSFFSGKKLLLIGIVLLVIIAIPVTLLLTRQEQNTQSNAAKATKLFFANSGQMTAATTLQKNVGDTISLDVVMDPGTNQVSFAKIIISYDGTKLTDPTIKVNEAAFPSVLEGPVTSAGNISVTVAIGSDPTKVIQTPTKVATITLKAAKASDTPVQVVFGTKTQVLSIATGDLPSENVLSSQTPIAIQIGGGAGGTPGPTTANNNQAPICTSLNVDRNPAGAAAFSIAATATGSDADGTITKVTFNFGDGPVQDITQGGGIGTNAVSVQVAHTYNNPGTYQVSTILTDNVGGVSANTCTQTVNVTENGVGGPGGGNGGPAGGNGQGTQASGSANVPGPTTYVPVATVKPPTPTLAPTGPGDTVLSIGVVGAIISIAGALVFFAL